MTAIKTLCIALTALLFSASAVAFEPNLNDEMELDVARAILNIEWRDASENLISYESYTVADATTPTDQVVDFSVTSGPWRRMRCEVPGGR